MKTDIENNFESLNGEGEDNQDPNPKIVNNSTKQWVEDTFKVPMHQKEVVKEDRVVHTGSIQNLEENTNI